MGEAVRSAIDADQVLHKKPASILSVSQNGVSEGQEFDGYRIIQRIGNGAFGNVWRAYQEKHDRFVAVKILKNSNPKQQKVELKEELRSLTISSHPNVVHFYDSGEVDGRQYIAMEYVEGGNIVEYFEQRETPFTLRDRLSLFRKVCDGVQHFHMHRVIHNDLKPENILVDKDGRPKIADFGLSLHDIQARRETLKEFNMYSARGTIDYASPEALDPEKIADTRTDIYSLGVILIRLLIGATPYSIESEFQDRRVGFNPPLSDRAASELVSFVSENNRVGPEQEIYSFLSGELDAIITNAIKPSPNHRFQSVEAFAKEIDNFLESRCVRVYSRSKRYWLKKFIQRSPLLASSIAALFIAAIVLVVLSINLRMRNSDLKEANQEIERQVFDLEIANKKEAKAKLEAMNLNTAMKAVFEGFNPTIAEAGDGKLRGAFVSRLAVVADQILSQGLASDEDGLALKKHLAETLNLFGDNKRSQRLWKSVCDDSLTLFSAMMAATN